MGGPEHARATSGDACLGCAYTDGAIPDGDAEDGGAQDGRAWEGDGRTPTLSAGGLAVGYPLDLPSGPGGLTPKLELSYDSAATNDMGSVQAANGRVAHGFTLGSGSISWGEHQDSTCSGCTWESSWQLNDAFGTAAELVPPNLTVATGNDDTGHAPAARVQ